VKEASDEENYWTEEITAKSGWLSLQLNELWRYRDLILLFVNRDFISVYKQTILGPVWFFLQPLLTTLTYGIIFGNIAQLSTDGLPKILFYMSGVVTWQYFSSCLNKTSGTFINNAGIFGKVYFPRLVIPIANVIGALISFLIQFSFFVLLMLYYKFVENANIHPNAYILLTPLLLLLMALLGLSIGIIISSLTIKYRDLNFLVAFGVQLLMFATPVIYPLSVVKGRYRELLYLNPLTEVIEIFRYGFLGAGTININHLIYSFVFTFILLVISIIIFNRVEKTFMDTV
jgi:lipopolysaccharide transport system permease protein